MGRGPETFRISDLKRAIEGVRRAGLDIASITVDRSGVIEVIPAAPQPKRSRPAAAASSRGAEAAP
jgi:hypothetical protein